MKRTAILSTTADPNYLFCLPIVAKSWELQGFIPHIISVDGLSSIIYKYLTDSSEVLEIKNEIYSENNPALLSQCCRLYRPSVLEGYVILGDVDMFMCSDFLNRDYDKVNVFGHDLTGFVHIPMCYVGMDAEKWKEVMRTDTKLNLTDQIFCDLKIFCDLTTKVSAWVADQDILTARLLGYGYDKVNFISRGVDPANQNLPLGRWDRYGGFKKPSGVVHDAHLPREPWKDENFFKVENMCNLIYPNTDWSWLRNYRKEFLNNRQSL